MHDGVVVGVVIPAAGEGVRMGSGGPKQFLELAGRPIIAWTLEQFQQSPEIDTIVVVTGGPHIPTMERIVSEARASKVCAVVAGGIRRQDSVRNGLRALESREVGIVLVHDAVRPFFDGEMISRVLAALSGADGVIAAIPSKDTIKLAGRDGFVASTPRREDIRVTQTPQAFRYPLLCAAFQRAENEGFYGTDEAGLVERLGKKVAIVEGSSDNIKITTPGDLELANLIIQRRLGHTTP